VKTTYQNPPAQRIFDALALVPEQRIGRVFVEALDRHGRDVSWLTMCTDAELAGYVETYAWAERGES
jgi:hypothetical protein